MNEPRSPIDAYIEFRDAQISLSEMCDRFGIPKYDHEDVRGMYPLSLPDRALQLCRRFEHGLAWGRSEGESVAMLKRKFVKYGITANSPDGDDPPFIERVSALVEHLESSKDSPIDPR